MVIDTDTFNEVDDQIALAYLLRNPDRLRLQAIYAAPFLNEKADTPKVGMEKSYQEILKLLELAGSPEFQEKYTKGRSCFWNMWEHPLWKSRAGSPRRRSCLIAEYR